MRKVSGKVTLSLVLVLTMLLGSVNTVFAAGPQTIDPYTVESQYVQELVDLRQEEIDGLSLKEAKSLFEQAFGVSSSNYAEDEIRLALDGLAFGLKFQIAMDAVRKASPSSPNGPLRIPASSTTSGLYYSGSVGAAWIRDTTGSGSPLTLGEILSGTYTLEVDYITWDTAASILVASGSYNAFDDLVLLLAQGASGGALSYYICTALGIANGPAAIASVAVGTAVAWGWNWLNAIDRTNMKNCFDSMSKTGNYMKVQFMWSSNMVNKFYTSVTKTTTMPNPFPGTYGNWYSGSYGYLYSY